MVCLAEIREKDRMKAWSFNEDWFFLISECSKCDRRANWSSSFFRLLYSLLRLLYLKILTSSLDKHNPWAWWFMHKMFAGQICFLTLSCMNICKFVDRVYCLTILLCINWYARCKKRDILPRSWGWVHLCSVQGQGKPEAFKFIIS